MAYILLHGLENTLKFAIDSVEKERVYLSPETMAS